MITKNKVRLFSKQENYVSIIVTIGKRGRIKTHWYVQNIKRIVKYNEKLSKNVHEILNRLKTNGCAICGYNKYPEVLDFHHVNPQDKKFNVNATSTSKTNEKISEEINKCILLCKNCHYEVHRRG